MQPKIIKRYMKRLTIMNRYVYKVYEVDANGNKWLEAQPVGKGIVRTAENEQILLILLNNDALNMNKEQQRVR